MAAILSTDAAAPVGASENLQYTPPSGSMLVGGSVNVSLYADGGGYNASGTAVVYTPALKYDGSDVVFQCAWGLAPCSSGAAPHDFAGVIELPANRDGDFYLAAGCGGDAGESCNEDGSNDAWALAELSWAHFLLFNGSSPAASGFGGSLLSSAPPGTADLSFTATDPTGPGVYNVTLQIDGQNIYDATPDTNSGHCVSVGTDNDNGALMFDWQQPCPASEFVDVPVDTAALTAGQHLLKVTVTDAAGNASTVLDQTIGTETVSTPRPRPHHVRARLLIFSRYNGAHTRLVRIKAIDLPRNAKVTIACRGRGCPRHSTRTASAKHVRRLWKSLTRHVFIAGDRELFTITAPGLLPERSELIIRNGTKPISKSL